MELALQYISVGLLTVARVGEERHHPMKEAVLHQKILPIHLRYCGGGGGATRGILQKKLAMQDNSAGIHATRSVGGKASSDEGSCPSTHVQLGSTSNGKHWPIRRRPWVPMEMSGVDLSPTPIHTRGLIPMELPLPTGKLRPWEQDSRCQWPQVEGQKCPLPPFVGLLLVLWVGFGIIF